MTALTIFAIVLSYGAVAFCVYTNYLHEKDDETTLKLMKQHDEIMRHMANCMGLLDQRIKMLEQEVKKGESNGRMDKG